MSRQLLLSGLTALALFGISAAPVRAQSQTLADLPFGSVIQVVPTDSEMCDDVNCAVTTMSVLPLKFVKMQARNAAGAALGDVTGYSNAASFGDSNTYTYWMLLDNYCWWGNAQCQYANALSARYQAWNGVSGTADSTYSNNISMVMGNTNTGTTNANAASLRNNNALNTLDNFYDSLPDNMGNRPKATTVPNYAWDMQGYSMDTTAVAGWFNAGSRPWQTGTWDPTAGNGNSFVFSGTNAAPVMTSRVGLPSFTEWQGGTTGYTSYAGQTAENGSGGSFCKARFDTDCTNGNSFGLFAAGAASSSNPSPRYPWLRSPGSTNADSVWFVGGYSGTSLSYNYAGSSDGISPVLWLSSDISILGGEGDYATPFCINTGDCEDEIISNICTATDDPNGIRDIGDCAWREYDTIVGMVGIAQILGFTVEETLTISTDDTISTDLTPTATGTQVDMGTTVEVSTNNTNGYYLTLENTSTTQTALVSGSNTIASIGSTEMALTNGTWGFRLGTNPLSSVPAMTNFAGVPLRGAPVTIANVNQEVSGDATPVTYGVKADTTQPTGTYTATLLYTAVAGNP